MTKRTYTGKVPPEEISEEHRRFHWHLTRAEIDAVIHHVHPIPLGRGFHLQHMRTHYRGDFSEFLNTFKAAGVIIRDGRGNPLVGRCHWRVKALHFNSREDFAVEWLPEETPDDDRFLYQGESTPPGNGSFLVSASSLRQNPEESIETILGETLGRNPEESMDTADDVTPDEI